MAATQETQIAEPRWPRWAWFVFPALAIAIGGSLGWIVGAPDPAAQAQPAQANRPPAERPAPPAPTSDPPVAAEPDPEIEVEPQALEPGTHKVRPAIVKPKHRPKPAKTTPCNVYDHMDGC